MSRLIILAEDESDYNYMIDAMFAETEAWHDFIKYEETCCNSKLMQILKKSKVQIYTKGIFNFILLKNYKLYSILKKYSPQYDRVDILFLNSSFIKSRYPPSVLKSYRQRFQNLHFILFYIDIVNHPVSWHANYLREKNLFDIVYSIDEKDAQMYQFRLWNTPYSVVRQYKKIDISYDIYFCGVTKGRTELLLEFIKSSRAHNITLKMDIVCTENEIDIIDSQGKGISTYKPGTCLPYPEVLSSSLKAKCILEIVQENQTALTLRAYEAVVYNRKLLTNNPTILKFPYYNPISMQYFEKVENIDWEWILSEDNVDYQYKGEFSPRFLLDNIIEG